jgi:hypothetical protein
VHAEHAVRIVHRPGDQFVQDGHVPCPLWWTVKMCAGSPYGSRRTVFC